MIAVKKINSRDAWSFLREERDSVLVDVRTPEEWEIVGRPDLSEINKRVVCISWIYLQDGKQNPAFFLALEEKIENKDSSLLFICRSGVRSASAASAALEHGYTDCFNVIDGFEGDALGVKQGWRRSLLPTVTGSI